MKPRQRALDDPAGAAEAAAMRAAAFRQLAGDPASFECIPMRLGVIPSITLH
jgi:hypothetical protein